MKPTSSPQPQGEDEEIIKLLKTWGSYKVDYPPELLASRRARFVEQARHLKTRQAETAAFARENLRARLESLGPVHAEYPQELLAARRAKFLAQVEERMAAKEAAAEPDAEIVALLSRLKSVEAPYPPRLLAARRAAFRRQVALGGRTSLLDALYFSIQELLQFKITLPSMPPLSSLRAPLAIAVLMLFALLGTLTRTGEPAFVPAHTPGTTAQQVPLDPSSTVEAAQTICKPGYVPPLCLAKEFDKTRDLTFPGNGSARPAVAKDTLPGYSGVHKPAFVNDGLYGPGASWVSNSPYSWIKIDLGKATTINTVTFGRDRLGTLNDGDPGQFIVSVALEDEVYANGDSSEDYLEYTPVYHSRQAGFSGIVTGAETVKVDFEPVSARFVKITFANEGTAVDEVEVFMIQPATYSDAATRQPRDDDPTTVPATVPPTRTPEPTDTPTPEPTDTPVPTDTATPRPTSTPTDVPTSTPRPTRTPTPEPTSTPRPTRTPTPEPTSTPRPTSTPTPEPTDTPQPTDTALPEPTDPPPTSIPQPTDTPEPPPTSTEAAFNPFEPPEPFLPVTETPFVLERP